MTTVINTPNLQTIPAQQPQILQHPQVMQPPQIIQQQPQVIHTPIQQGCCGPMPKIIPDNLRPAVFRVGICALVNGLISTIFGIVGFFTTSVRIQGHHYTYYYSNVLAYIAPDIWCGIFKMVAVQYNGSNQVVTFGQQGISSTFNSTFNTATAIVYPTSQPVYLQAAPGGHYTTAMNPNSVAPTSIQQVAPPQYGNLPQTKISN
ncbi:hypothetical protein TrispH2_008322 [Trichoplax sp. H2]|nr:hypothetical protein TrispH2_008322 [Trichoplax sp. H2]|eukprot:RDD39314.1 hypothetical protein TrispH2_008322 [Trichoplax sp. H2]